MIVGIYFVLAGLAFLMLEFYLPGGLFGVLSLMALCGAFSTWFAAGFHAAQLIACFIAVAGAAALISFLALKTLQRGAAIESKSEKGHLAAQYRTDLVGSTGRAATDLSPSGMLVLQSERFAAVSQGGFIAKGTPVKVIGGEGFSLNVVPIN